MVERGRARADLGAKRLQEFRSHAEHWRLGHGRTTEKALERLRRNPHIEYAEPDYIVQAALVPNDQGYPSQWGLNNTGQTGGFFGVDIVAEPAWNVSTGDRSVLVGVIDSGIDYAHADLAENIWINPGEIPGNGVDDDGNGFVDDIHGWDFANDDNDPMDDFGHGTHVAGIIGAIGNNHLGVAGVAWNVSLVPLKFLGSTGNGSTSAAVRAIDYAIGLGVRILNSSWGGEDLSQTLAEEIEAANRADVVFVAAAGNFSSDNDSVPFYPASYDVPNVISVAAIDHYGQKAAFSNYGAQGVHIAAPGKDILSTIPNGEYGPKDGTSMAAPHVAGAAALIRSLAPDIPAVQVKQKLLDTATPSGSLSGLVQCGGYLNAFVPILTRDDIPPGAIADLAVESSFSNSIRLIWSATGDDDGTGRAVSYDLHYSTDPITADNFMLGSQAPNAPVPKPAGSLESVEIPGLESDRTYYFAIRALDEWGNPGAISNVASGTTLPPPTFASSPASFSAALTTGESTSRILTIRNAGVGTLDWTIPLPVISGPEGVGGPAGAAVTEGVAPASAPEVEPLAVGIGGPDAFGYRFIDSDQPGGPEFDWVDLTVSGAGIPIDSLFTDDQISEPIALGFAFPFYGQTFETVRVSTNGFLTFTGGNAPYANKSLPNLSAPPNLVAPFWDDLKFVSVNRASYARDANSFTVQFTGVPPYTGLGDFTFQATLFRDGEILFRYLSMSGETGSATIGIQDQTQTKGLQVAFNSLYLHNQLAIRIYNVPQWLRISPTAGRLAGAESTDVTLAIDATGLEGGTYSGTVLVASNDPLQSLVSHPVSLEVTPVPMIALDVGSLDFGNVFIGATRSLSVAVRNTGTEVLHVSGVATDAPELTAAPSVFSVEKGLSQTVTVTFAPTASGVFDMALSLTSDAANAPELRVPVHGTASPPPEVTVTPQGFNESLLTGQVLVRTLRITNTGGSNLQMTVRAEIGGLVPWLRVAPGQDTIAPGAAHDFQVTMDADDFGTIGLSGALIIETNIPGAATLQVPVVVNITGAPNIAISDEPILVTTQQSFGMFGASTSHRLPIAYAPGGAGAIQVTVEGNFGNPSEYALATAEGVALGSVGRAGIDCVSTSKTFPIDSAQLAALLADDVLEVTVKNTDFVDTFCQINRHTIQLSYMAANTILDFGPQFIGLRKDLAVAVHNRGSEPLKIQSIITGIAEFIPSAATIDIPARSTARLAVTFAPSAEASFNSTLTIASNDPDTPVVSLALRGTGLDPPVIEVSPSEMSVTMFKKSTQTRTLTITNSGVNDLAFSLNLKVRTTAPDPSLCNPSAYVTEWSAGRMSAINLVTGATSRISFGLRTPQENLVIDPSGTTGYVAESDLGALSAIDLATGAVTRLVSGFEFPVGVALVPTGGTAYVSEALGGRIDMVDLSTHQITPIATGLGAPNGMTLNAALTTLYVTERGAGKVSAVDLSTGNVTTILSGLVGPNSIVLNRDETAAYVTETGGGRLIKIYLPGPAFQVVASGLLDPQGLALNAAGTLAYIAEFRRDRVKAINLASAVPSLLGVGLSGPAGVALLTPSGCQSSFLTIDPMSGQVPPGGALDLPVVFASGDLFGGTYQTDIEIASNDPIKPLVKIPAILNVNPICPDLDKDGYALCTAVCALAGNNRCGDCDDADPVVRPFKPETCNGLDDNCNGLIDESIESLDADGDLIGDTCDICPLVWDPEQIDTDADGTGDPCEPEAICQRANMDAEFFSKERIDGRDLVGFARAFGTCPDAASAAFAANLDMALYGPAACVDLSDFHLFMSVFALSCGGT